MGFSLKREDEEIVFKKRLLHDGHGSGEDKRLVSIIRNITKLAYCQGDVTKLHGAICKDLGLAANAAERQEKVFKMYDETMDHLENCIISKREELSLNRSKLETLKLELEFVEKLREVEKYPDSSTSEAKMKELNAKKQILLEKIDKQRASMAILTEACRNLQLLLDGGDQKPKQIEQPTPQPNQTLQHNTSNDSVVIMDVVGHQKLSQEDNVQYGPII